MNNKGLTVHELIVLIFLVGIIAFNIWIFANYGNKPVSEMPIWLYWLLKD